MPRNMKLVYQLESGTYQAHLKYFKYHEVDSQYGVVIRVLDKDVGDPGSNSYSAMEAHWVDPVNSHCLSLSSLIQIIWSPNGLGHATLSQFNPLYRTVII